MGRGGKSGGSSRSSSGGSFSSRSSSSGSFSSRSSGSSSRGSSSISRSSSSGGSSGSNSFGRSSSGTSNSGSSYKPPKPTTSAPRPAAPPSTYRPTPPPMPRTVYVPTSRPSRTVINNYGGSYGNNTYSNRPVNNTSGQRQNQGSGCLWAVVGGIITMFAIIFLISLFSGNSNGKTLSTVNREPLSSGICIESNHWYEDHLDWIGSEATLVKGMKQFYQKTGVQPYLIITDNVNGKGSDLTDDEARVYLEKRYDELFDDKGHLIFLFMEYEDGVYKEYIFTGNQASAVIDNEAKEIIYDFVDQYYTSSLNEDAYFSTAFEKAAERIMKKTTTSKDIVAKLIGVIGLIGGISIIGFVFVNKKKYEAKTAEENRRILEAPIGNISDDSLKDKYK